MRRTTRNERAAAEAQALRGNIERLQSRDFDCSSVFKNPRSARFAGDRRWYPVCSGRAAMSAPATIVVASPDRVEITVLCQWLAADGLGPGAAPSLQAAQHQVQSRTYDVLIADSRFAFGGD